MDVMSNMFPPSAASGGYGGPDPGTQGSLLHAPPTMYSPHTHMLPYNYSGQLGVQSSSPGPGGAWQAPSPHTATLPHCSTPTSMPPTPDNAYSSHLSFNGSRDPYIQGAAAIAAAGGVHQGPLQPPSPINAYQAYAATWNWRTSYDMSSLQSSLQVQGLQGNT